MQVGYSANNYYGWSWEKEKKITASEYYDSARFNQDKVRPDDRILNKGGNSIDGTFHCHGAFKCEMVTDNQSDSHPQMTL